MPGEHQDEQRQEGRPSEEAAQRKAAKPSEPGTTAVSTSDPAIKSGEAMVSRPEQVVSYQTTHVSAPPNPYPFEPGGDVLREREQQGEKGEQGQQKRKGGERSKQQNGQGGGNEQGKKDDSQLEHGRHDEAADGERSREKKRRHEVPVSAVNWKTLALSAVLALVCGVGGAWAYSAFFGPSKSDKQDKKDSDKGDSGGKSRGGKSSDNQSGKSGSGSGSRSSEGGASASEIPGFSSAMDAETFRKELEHLSHRLDLLAGRIDQLTQPQTQTPPVLHTLQEKVNELESDVDRVANLPRRLEQLQQKLSSTTEELKMLKERVSGEEMPLGKEVAPTAPEVDHHVDTPVVPLGSEPIASDNPANQATLKLGIGLFREGHYSQSYDVLRRLQRERPQDARVWYYSALAHGMATGNWSGKTKQLAEQGLACEKSGKQPREEIEASLADLPPDSGQRWLADLRRQVKIH